MTLWIKICGMTTPDGIEACLAAGVDAIGFVFAESVRRVTPEQAADLVATAGARGRVVCTAVTRHPTQQIVDEILDVFKPDLLQTDAEDLHTLRLPQQLPILPVIRRYSVEDSQLPPRLLFEGPTSGSGRTSDWGSAHQLARKSQLILAGGLNATNVGAAIAAVDPFGVDVSSGVEARPGIKSQAEIARFVTAARDAYVARGPREGRPASIVSGQTPAQGELK